MRLADLQLAVDQVARGLAGKIDLVPQFVPTIPVDLRKTLIEKAHLFEEFALRHRPVANPDRRDTTASPAPSTRSPVDENQQHEDRDHTPEDELEVTQIVA